MGQEGTSSDGSGETDGATDTAQTVQASSPAAGQAKTRLTGSGCQTAELRPILLTARELWKILAVGQ